MSSAVPAQSLFSITANMSKRNISDLTELLKQWDGTNIMVAIKALPPAKRAKVFVEDHRADITVRTTDQIQRAFRFVLGEKSDCFECPQGIVLDNKNSGLLSSNSSIGAGQYVRILSSAQLFDCLLAAMEIVFKKLVNQLQWEHGKSVPNFNDIIGLEYEDSTLDYGAWLATNDAKFINLHAAEAENLRSVLALHSLYTQSAVFKLE
ncbi:hypothetical protein BKA64DRAFT_431128 [Cadophora sp. MPI-SDFR-AT-0126]|nr:hypothetical protein BKA64DRAFT_431128 [Leotiomycetes sp. MPI-SDFR-AT-0126]